VWSRDLVKETKSTTPLWGFSASPVVIGDLVIVHAGATPGGSFLGLDRRTGKEVWRALGDPLGYATPLIIQNGNRKQLVCWTPSHVRGLDPATGKVAWSHEYKVHNGVSISMPIFHRGIVLVSNYWEGVQAIKLTDNLTKATLAWEDRRNLRSLMSQPLYRGAHGYLIDKRHGLTCFELATGKKIWDDGNRMTPKGRNPQATMVWLGESDRAVVLNSDGELLLVRLQPGGYQEISRTRVIGPTWAHPAYAWGCVYVRNDDTITCIEVVPAPR
jgi:outer membrane protein assembly factor BamB